MRIINQFKVKSFEKSKKEIGGYLKLEEILNNEFIRMLSRDYKIKEVLVLLIFPRKEYTSNFSAFDFQRVIKPLLIGIYEEDSYSIGALLQNINSLLELPEFNNQEVLLSVLERELEDIKILKMKEGYGYIIRKSNDTVEMVVPYNKTFYVREIPDKNLIPVDFRLYRENHLIFKGGTEIDISQIERIYSVYLKIPKNSSEDNRNNPSPNNLSNLYA